MPRYFFDLQDGVDVHDETGQALPSLEAARAEALRRAAGHLTGPSDRGAVIVTVRDETDRTVMTVRLVSQVETSAPSDAPATAGS